MQEQARRETDGGSEVAADVAPQRQVLGISRQDVRQQSHLCTKTQERTRNGGEALKVF